ncbi:signal peptidase II [Sulfobacillus thermosulfidooxidans DSM 9293]|uniref:Lipoprotein signal peptidase n=1 Tax=Sulfobacillus thermosulfidooxidans (strain DSM 9293 / VKM B-1269 / AT-1) TaxID=929705 RepID=A0A1W1WNQ0_SULTA|nr:signal peptidase II [Sulfobacillus thermosulfidooxidans]SMC07640.1 signal peptidase II [Sulfobacillus thermosulfidooxidans DSM 9293]
MSKPALGIVVIGTVILASDLLIQSRVSATMVPGQSIPILPPVLSLTYVLNNGAAFSLLRGGTPLFILVAFALLIGIGIYTWRHPHMPSLMVIALGLLAGGSAGNLWDRIIWGRVIDYIHVIDWPVFNLADSAIVVGMGLLVYYYWRLDKNGESSS